MTWLANSSDLNLFENYGGNFNKDDPLEAFIHQRTAIQESWNQFGTRYFFKLLKSISERIKVVIKAWWGATND